MKAKTFTGSTQQFQDFDTVDDALNAAQAHVEACDVVGIADYVSVFKTFDHGVVVWTTAFYSGAVDADLDEVDLS